MQTYRDTNAVVLIVFNSTTASASIFEFSKQVQVAQCGVGQCIVALLQKLIHKMLIYPANVTTKQKLLYWRNNTFTTENLNLF